jgi:hypothetical protein
MTHKCVAKSACATGLRAAESRNKFDNALTFFAKMLSKQEKTLLGGGA